MQKNQFISKFVEFKLVSYYMFDTVLNRTTNILSV